MSLLEILQLVGYSTAAALHLWFVLLLVRRRSDLRRLERVLTFLALAIGLWHACNLLLALHAMTDLDTERWETFLRLTNTVAVISITLTYSLLLHLHLHLWANARKRPFTFLERARVYLSYTPLVFLPIAVRNLWREPYGPMFESLSSLTVPFALWASYCLCLAAATDFLIARSSQSASEKRLLKTLAASFVGIAALILSVYVLGLGERTAFAPYAQSLANLGSLLPTALLAYHIYRYRYLELIIKESLIVATFASFVLVLYLYGIRTLGAFLTESYGLRPGVVETILILTLALFAAPLRNWLDERFHKLFEKEATLYREVVTSIGANAGRYTQLPELLRFVEERIASGLGLRNVRILTVENSKRIENSDEPDLRSSSTAGFEVNASYPFENEASSGEWMSDILKTSRAYGFEPVEGGAALRERGFELAFPLRRERREIGLMLVDAAHESLTRDVRSVLEILAGQVAVAIDDCRLVSENVQLERRLAQRERLAALGQMAATIAHEIRNPLSSIKSIVQVMREDEQVREEFQRDLDLIVGETDRLSRSVTQMLSFARNSPHDQTTRNVAELLSSVVRLAREEAREREVSIEFQEPSEELRLGGEKRSALRDAVSNLLLNALQASPKGGVVRLEVSNSGGTLLIAVEDEGRGVDESLNEKIWEPFFTTKQRGTGLGLAIVRKRIEEAGGTAQLAPSNGSSGARFELRMPVD